MKSVHLIYTIMITALLYLSMPLSSHAAERLPIQLAKPFKQPEHIEQYFISEKLDGIRGYWTGKQLLTRSGQVINTPTFFTLGWPEQPLDGELWLKRQAFEETLSIVTTHSPNTTQWQNIRFMVFDLPQHQGMFSERVREMERMRSHDNHAHLGFIKQFKVNSTAHLQQVFNNVVQGGGEGLMLHHQNALYQSGRNKHLMKLKPFSDAEATVIAHIEGKGKYQGQLGAIQVKTAEGLVFKIGSGFSDIERKNPPKIGSVITFKYSGKTKRGVPRFASYLRVRRSAETSN